MKTSLSRFFVHWRLGLSLVVLTLLLYAGLIEARPSDHSESGEVKERGLVGGAPAWHPLISANAAPTPRDGAAMVYDRVRKRLIVFGGKFAGYRNDTWEFDLATLEWRELATGGAVRPPARFSMVYGIDYARDRLLITTGQGEEFYNDVWAFDLTTDTWSELLAQGGPVARYGAAGGVFDGNLLYVTHGFAQDGRYDDTWAFNTANDQWIQVTPGGTLPIPRCLHAAAMPTGSSLVLFGGCGSPGPCPLGDTWRYNAGGGWTQIGQGDSPEKRTFSSLAAMGSSQQLLLYGGEAQGGGLLNDLWLLDVPAGEWTQLHPTGGPPGPSSNHNLVWVDGPADDPDNGYMVLFGGDLAEMWMLLPQGLQDISGVTLTGQPATLGNTPLTFEAAVQPGSATPAITYHWEATSHSLRVHTSGLTEDQTTYSWVSAGPKTVTVTAYNTAGQATASQTVQILVPSDYVYLPMAVRN